MDNHRQAIATGSVFNNWTIIKEVPKQFPGEPRIFECSCTCGKIKNVRLLSLTKGTSKGCGRHKAETIEVISGEKRNMLTIIKEVAKKDHYRMILCQCDCGHTTITRLSAFRGGSVRSCGCIHGVKRKPRGSAFGLSKSRIYGIWKSMFQRCYDSNCKAFKNYGGRGILICDEWITFKNFYEWSNINGYDENLTIDRINNNLGYSPGNCKWSTQLEQGRNTRRLVYICHNGQTKCIAEWASIFGINAPAFRQKITNKTPEQIESVFSQYQNT